MVVPSPTMSEVLLATSLTILAPMFLKGSGSSISLLTETPSLVTLGEPQLLCNTTLRPVGPSVTLTAAANCLRPSRSSVRAASSNINCFAIFDSLVSIHTHLAQVTIRLIRINPINVNATSQ